MSLIQEALRRRNEDTGGANLGVAPATPALPPPPPDLPPVPPPPEPKRNQRTYLVVLLVVLLLAGLGFGAWWLFLRPPPPAALAARPTPKPAAAKIVPAPPPPHTNLVAQVKAKLAAIQTPERLELVAGVTNTPLASPPLPAPDVTTKPPPVLAPATNQPAAALNAPPPAAPVPAGLPLHVNWPKLNVTGIMGRAGGDAVVFINGQILKAGDLVAGARLLAVQENGALLLLEGETNFFRVGKGGE